MELPNLDKLREAEAKNYSVSLERLGATATLAEDFADAYDAISRLLRETSDPPDHLYVVSVLFLACRYQFEKAILDVLRGRLSDGFQSTRRAIELAAFAAKIHRYPHLADVWLEASRDEESYERYRKKFRKDLYPRDDDILGRLGRRYDYGSKHFHGSPFSVGGRAKVEPTTGAVEFTFRTFEIDDDDPSEPASSFLWVVDTHFGILELFIRILQEQLGQRLPAWHVREASIATKLEAHRQEWAPTIRERIARNASMDTPE